MFHPRRMLRRVYRQTRKRLLGRHLGSVTHVATEEPAVALTFDDGPDPASTPALLDLLARHDARGTFFMLGEAAEKFPDLVRRVAAEGHAIGNHTWDHPAIPLLSRRERVRQIRACQRALAPLGQPLFRPPFGEQSLAARIDLLRAGYDVVTWNLDSEDWWNPDASAIAERLLRLIRPGSIVLLHDSICLPKDKSRLPDISRPTHYDRSAMLDALRSVLGALRPAFRFVTVPELLQLGAPQRTLWFDWRDARPDAVPSGESASPQGAAPTSITARR